MIVVDTSAWIELLRGTRSSVERELRRLLARQAEVAVTEVVVAEVLAGARDEAHADELREQLLGFPVLGLGGLAGFEAAAQVLRDCCRRGLTVRRLADCLIAVPTIAAGAALLHADADFDRIARCTDLRIHAVSGAA